VVVGVVAAAACAPQMTMSRARTLQPGTAQVGAGVEAAVVAPPVSSDAKVPLANLAVGYRRGVADGFDAGARSWIFGIPAFWTWGIAGDAKWQLRTSPSPGRGVDVALGGILAYQQVRNGGTPWHIGAITLPLLIGHNFGKHQLVWGPRLSWALLGAEGQRTIDIPAWGLSVGFAWRFARRWEFVPELTWMYSPIHMNGEVMTQQGATGSQLTLGLTYRL
jgi:hypothetical protein